MKFATKLVGVLGVALALATSQVFADQAGELCAVFTKSRNELAALNRQIANESNPLKKDALARKRTQVGQNIAASIKDFLNNHLQFADYSGVISGFRSDFYANGPGAHLSIDLPCKVTISFRFLGGGEERTLNPQEDAFLSKWRTALENVALKDTVTFSGRFYLRHDLFRQDINSSFNLTAVLTELRKKNGGIAYKVPDEYLLRKNAAQEDEVRKGKIIQGIASQLTGKWEGEWKMDGILNPMATNGGKFSLDLMRNGSSLTGTYLENGGSSNVSGAADGKQVSFQYQYSDGSVRRFAGTISASGEISGKWDQGNRSGTWKMLKTASAVAPSNTTASTQTLQVGGQEQQPVGAGHQSACDFTPVQVITTFSELAIDNPYVGGCKNGRADGHGSYTISYRNPSPKDNQRPSNYVIGEFREGNLHGQAILTITQPDRIVEGEFRNNRPWNTVVRWVDSDGVRHALQTRDGIRFAVCRSDGKREENCTDRESLLGTR